MDIRFENRSAFYVSGYSVETNESSHEKDIALLREKHEDKLRSISKNGFGLYFVTWLTESNNYIYLFGIEKHDKTPIDEAAACVKIPAANFAVATVPGGMPVLEAWAELFETGLQSVGSAPNTEHGIYFEFFNEIGVCEIWVPVI